MATSPANPPAAPVAPAAPAATPGGADAPALWSRRRFAACTGAAAAGALLGAALPGGAWAQEAGDGAPQIAILHTNDVHCAIAADDDGHMGYAKVAALLDDARDVFGRDNAILVDAGDFLQGNNPGTLTRGHAPARLMAAAGYGVVALGNHDFDFGLDVLRAELADAPFAAVSCNVSVRGERLVAPYVLRELGGCTVAFVGITTPETLAKTSPAVFQDETGATIVDFCQDATGDALYRCVQAAVDEARAQGAAYVVALAHLGQNGSPQVWRSDTLVRNTTGIDVLVDGHSHEAFVQTVANAAGQDVIITQTGTKLTAVGCITIDSSTQRISAQLLEAPAAPDPQVDALVSDVLAELSVVTDTPIATADFRLAAYEADGTWAVRRRETNLGDLVADAYRTRMGTQVAVVNAGGLRADVEAGTVTYGHVLSVSPFGNTMAVLEVSGQTLLDALEFGVSLYPERNGAFLQVSGLAFTLNAAVPSSVLIDADSAFAGVVGDYRVGNVTVGDAPLDPTATYTLAGNSFMLAQFGDGFSMFRDATVITAEGPQDHQVLVDFITEDLGGVIPADYAANEGQGRITVVNAPADEDLPQRASDYTATVIALGGLAALAAAAVGVGVATRKQP